MTSAEPLLGPVCLMNILIPLAVASLLAGGAEWKAISPKGTRFSVNMPGQPTESSHAIKAIQGPINIRLYSLTTKAGSYVAGVTEHPETAFVAGQDQSRLDQARDGAVQQAKGRLRSESKIVVDGRPGREISVATETGHAVKIRLIADRHRLYQVMVVGSTRFLASPDAVRFLESFRLTN